jgi:SAM-dependent methyltransferase
VSVFEAQATVDSWDRDYYHPIAERLYDRAIPAMLKLMGASGTVLDAGCGPGVHSIRAANAGLQVHALDISQMMLGQATQRAARAGVADKITFQQGDLTNLSLPDASYDHVFCWGVLMHVHEIERALSELARIVRHKGSLALYVTNHAALDNKIETLARAALGKRTQKEQHPLGPGTWYEMHGERLWVRQFNVPNLIRHMTMLGFTCTARRAGELSEIQRRLPFGRGPLLSLNNLWFAAGLPASVAVGNILVFRKERVVAEQFDDEEVTWLG